MQNITDPSLLLQSSVKGIEAFYLLREQPAGGFSAGRYMPPTIEDTYHALRCLYAVTCFEKGQDQSSGWNRWKFPGNTPVKVHVDFIKNRLTQEWNNARRLFQLLYSLEILIQADDLHPDLSQFVQYPEVRSFIIEAADSTGAIDELFHAVRISRLLSSGHISPLDKIFHHTDYSIKSLSKLRMFLYLHRELSGNPTYTAVKKWKEWIDRCRNDDGGYGFFPGTTSYTENVYAALKCCVLLGTKPHERDKTTGFLRACRSGRGGFGRRCQGIAFPDSTWYCVSSLITLACMNNTA